MATLNNLSGYCNIEFAGPLLKASYPITSPLVSDTMG